MSEEMSRPEAEPMRPLWCKEPCWNCGEEGYATRTQPKPKSEPYHCDVCEYAMVADTKHDAELAQLRAALANAKTEAERWKAKYIGARQSGSP